MSDEEEPRRWVVFQRLPAGPTHGKRSTYVTYGCRCPECTAANTAECRAYRRARAAVVADPAETTR